jgi:hypothetical protein
MSFVGKQRLRRTTQYGHSMAVYKRTKSTSQPSPNHGSGEHPQSPESPITTTSWTTSIATSLAVHHASVNPSSPQLSEGQKRETINKSRQAIGVCITTLFPSTAWLAQRHREDRCAETSCQERDGIVAPKHSGARTPSPSANFHRSASQRRVGQRRWACFIA